MSSWFTGGRAPSIPLGFGLLHWQMALRGLAIVLVGQSFDLAAGLADQVYLFRRGAVSKSGSTADLPRAVLWAKVSV